ncbi:MAG: PEP-CTERM sorting domain-containing protein [Chthonomonadales bacterium]|nr:PEP-CTERM sorting domain-containing protein [Chthonomonadales bacterium]
MHRALYWLAAFTLCMCVTTAVPAQEQISNGGFEVLDTNGEPAPWILDGQGITTTTSPVHAGFLAMQFSKVGSPATLTQTGIAAPWGHEFLIGFWLWDDTDLGVPEIGTKTFKVTFDGTEFDVGSGPSRQQWTYYSFYAYGTGDPSASIVFEGQHDQSAWILDDVSVFKTGEVVPEPALMQLPVLLGLAGLGYWRRRRIA